MKSFLRFLVIFLSSFVFINKAFAIDMAKPYQQNKNFLFTLDDTNTSLVNDIYFNDNEPIPSSFNLNNKMNIIVGDQKDLGLCGLFSTLKSAETNYALTNGNYIDYSERYIDYISSKYLYGIREPGILESLEGDAIAQNKVISVLESIGTVSEETVPYRNYSIEEIQNMKSLSPIVKATGAFEMSGFGLSRNTEERTYWINVIKKHIMKYGSVATSVNAPHWDALSHPQNALYYKTGVSPNFGGHGVSLVGWDDNYSKNNFDIKPQNDGAFLVLNSWGNEWGNNGYFWLSYESEEYSQFFGVFGTRKANPLSTYSNAEKLFYNIGGIANVKFIGTKFNKNPGTEYLTEIILDADSSYDYDEHGNQINNEVKAHFFLNPNDDTFDENKMIFLQTVEMSHFNLGVTLDKPIKLTGDSFSIVVQFEGDLSSVIIRNNVDNNDNELPNVSYGASSWDDSWLPSIDNLPIFAFTSNRTIKNVTLKSPPDKTIYVKGENLDYSGLKVSVEYDVGDIDEVEINDTNATISNYNPNKFGTQTVELNYKGHTISFNVFVKASATSMVVKTSPTKLKYAKGETLDLTGGVITINYEDETSEDIPMNSGIFSLSGFNPHNIGIQQVTINNGNLSTHINVEVVKTLHSIIVKEPPFKTIYVKGEQLELSGGILRASYDDNSTTDINMDSTDITYSNYDSSKLGKQTITLNYKNLHTTFDVIVKNEVVGITVKREPDKITYIRGDNFVLSGGILQVEYEDKTTQDIEMQSTEVAIYGYNANKIGTQQLTINYQGKQAKFNINVVESDNPIEMTIANPKTFVYDHSIAVVCVVVITLIIFVILKKKNKLNKI